MFYKVFYTIFMINRGPQGPRKKKLPPGEKIGARPPARGQVLVWGMIFFPGGPGPGI